MPEDSNADAARDTQKRVQPFLDCISFLLAKRWLREQREQEFQKDAAAGGIASR
jgi:hypothetical protein